MRRLTINPYLQSLGVIALTTGIGVLLRPYLQITDLAMLYLLAVVVVAYRHRRGPALIACLLSIAAFDFWFVPPYYTFDVHDIAYWLTFAVMLLVALIMSQLTARIREQAEDAVEREKRTAALFDLERELAGARDLDEQTVIVANHVGRAGHGPASVLLNDRTPGLRPEWPEGRMFESVAVRVAATWAHDHGESAGWGTSHCADAEALVIPVKSASRVMGIVTLEPDSADRTLSAAERLTVEALVERAAAAFERTILAHGEQRAREEVESERLRTALLSSLSHDLRSPLGSIEGAASTLVEDDGRLYPEGRRDMADTILEESRRMNRLITNLLDMVRVETGALAVQKQWQPLEEALGVALLRVEERLADHPVVTRLPSTLPLVPIDELLIEQVFINLLENAAKHTPAGTPITISGWTEGKTVVVEVADSGAGIPEGEEETIFRKFHRSSSADQASPAGGSGLGLTICRGIVTAHGGRIWLERNGWSGATFRFTIPLDGPPVAALPVPEAAESLSP